MQLVFNGQADRFQKNMQAITLLEQLRTERRPYDRLSEKEAATLAHYTAFGDSALLNKVIQNGGNAPHAMLANLSKEDIETLRFTALTAFYTPTDIIDVIWQALLAAGLDTIDFPRIIEPSAGIGNFILRMPARLRSRAKITAIELDRTSADILRYLHPDVQVVNAPFESVNLPNNTYDLAISNIPFGDIMVHDPEIPERESFLKKRIHDYFFAKALRIVRPGGIVAFLTSYGTMNKKDDRIRKWLAKHAELVAAYRLPQGIFRENAGSESATDLLILRKYMPGETPANIVWTENHPYMHQEYSGSHKTGLTTGSRIKVINTRLPNAYTEAMNFVTSQYFHDRPDHIIGTEYGIRNYDQVFYLVVPPTNTPIAASLDLSMRDLPTDLFVQMNTKEEPLEQVTIPVNRADQEEVLSINLASIPAKDKTRAEKLIEIYHIAKKVLLAERIDADEATIEDLRRNLNRLYDTFLRTFGPIGNQANQRILRNAPELAFLRALELSVTKKNATTFVTKKSQIFYGRTIKQERPPIVGQITPQDALVRSLDEFGGVMLPFIMRVSGQTKAQVIQALAGLIYQVPGETKETWVTADAYLSGNVRKKLKTAEAHASINPAYQMNVDALKNALPKPLSPSEIIANLGAPWIPADDVASFITSIIPKFQTPYARVEYSAITGKWNVVADHSSVNSIESISTWGTPQMNGIEIIQKTLDGQIVIVYDYYQEDGKTKQRMNETKTLAAQEKQNAIKDRFQAWVWEDLNRAERLAAKYNEEMNCITTRQYNGGHLTLAGMNTTILRDNDLSPWQKDAVWQALQNQSTLIAHAVGAGKTYEMIAIAHESRRLGLANKPMLAVPKGLVEQTAAAAHALFPGMRVFTMSAEDFKAENRMTMMSKIAMNEWDLVIVSHTSLTLLPIEETTIREFADKILNDLRALLENVKQDNPGDRSSIKDIERTIKNTETRLLDRIAQKTSDSKRAISWNDLGVDLLMVDEAHNFKNLLVPTRMGRISGTPTSNSARAFDMRIKTWYLLDRGGKVIYATGTPVLNSLSEVYIMMLYLQEPLLEAHGIASFDDWARTFAQTQMAFEMKPDGSGFRLNTRLSKFVNIPELSLLWRECMNVRTAQQLALPRPKLITGQSIIVEIPGSPRLRKFVKSLADRVERMKGGSVDPAKDNMLKITSEGRLAALDIRLAIGGPEDPNNKVSTLVRYLEAIYRKFDAERGTQMVFCDLATPKGASDKKTAKEKAKPQAADNRPLPHTHNDSHEENKDDEERAEDIDELEADRTAVTVAEQRMIESLYDDIRQKLMARGIPKHEIAFIHEYDSKKRREQLYAGMRDGSIRILIGSTSKMSAGLNVQDRLVALHHLDAPWRPGDIEQREGRILRQRNGWSHVYIYTYVTAGSFDGYIWQTLETKAGYITKIMAGEITQRTAEDVSEVVLNAAQVKAVASGNPQVVKKVQLEVEQKRLERLHGAWKDNKIGFNRERRYIENDILYLEKENRQLSEPVEETQKFKDKSFAIAIVDALGTDNAHVYTDRTKAAEKLYALYEQLSAEAKAANNDISATIANYKGFPLVAFGYFTSSAITIIIRYQLKDGTWIRISDIRDPNGIGIFTSLDNRIDGIEETIARNKKRIVDLIKRGEQLEQEITKPWDLQSQYDNILKEVTKINIVLANNEESASKAQAGDQAEPTTTEHASNLETARPANVLIPLNIPIATEPMTFTEAAKPVDQEREQIIEYRKDRAQGKLAINANDSATDAPMLALFDEPAEPTKTDQDPYPVIDTWAELFQMTADEIRAGKKVKSKKGAKRTNLAITQKSIFDL